MIDKGNLIISPNCNLEVSYDYDDIVTIEGDLTVLEVKDITFKNLVNINGNVKLFNAVKVTAPILEDIKGQTVLHHGSKLIVENLKTFGSLRLADYSEFICPKKIAPKINYNHDKLVTEIKAIMKDCMLFDIKELDIETAPIFEYTGNMNDLYLVELFDTTNVKINMYDPYKSLTKPFGALYMDYEKLQTYLLEEILDIVKLWKEKTYSNY